MSITSELNESVVDSDESFDLEDLSNMGIIKGKPSNDNKRLKRRQTILKKANVKNFVRGVEDIQQ